jgi:hypothetical protein
VNKNHSIISPGCLHVAMIAFVLAPCLYLAAKERHGLALAGGDVAEVHLKCEIESAKQSTWIQGPDGHSAALIVSSDDDHCRSHDCTLRYDIMIRTNTPQQQAPKSNILSADNDEWDRDLNAKLFGFSRDGKQIFGSISERGSYGFESIFSYDAATAQSIIGDAPPAWKRRGSAACGAAVVIGTPPDDQPVIERIGANRCRTVSRWTIGATDTALRELPAGERVIPLYGR